MNLSILVMYSKNDGKYLPKLLKSLPKGCEVILVDTIRVEHETNRLSNIRKGNIIKATYFYPEEYFDFAKARNTIQKLATKEWILWLDTDEHLDILQHEELKELIENADKKIGGFFLTQYSWLPSIIQDGTGQRSAVVMCRLFRNLPPFRYVFPIHEDVTPNIYDSGYLIQDSGLNILHEGWTVSKEEMIKKLERNYQSIWQNPKLIHSDRYKRYMEETLWQLKELKKG